MDKVGERMNDRYKFLLKLYDLSEGTETKIFNSWDIGKQLGFSRGNDHNNALGGIISIIHYGIVTVESDRRKENPLPESQKDGTENELHNSDNVR